MSTRNIKGKKLRIYSYYVCKRCLEITRSDGSRVHACSHGQACRPMLGHLVEDRPECKLCREFKDSEPYKRRLRRCYEEAQRKGQESIRELNKEAFAMDLTVGDRYKLLRKGVEVIWWRDPKRGSREKKKPVHAIVTFQPRAEHRDVEIMTNYGWIGRVRISRVQLKEWPKDVKVEAEERVKKNREDADPSKKKSGLH